jgi:pimeloyl-ACP methyl ester carboxylesterase
MLVDLVRVNTVDGVRLDGALILPASGAVSSLPIDAALLVHGAGGSFYTSSLLEPIAVRLAEQGTPTLLINTRGHDPVSSARTVDGPRRAGAAYERVSEALQDLPAWIEFLQSRGYKRVALVGHSLGAVKGVLLQAEAPQELVVCLIALSPPRLSCSYFLASAKGADFRAMLSEAEEHVRQGRGETLIESRFPLAMLITAAGYVDKYGPAERYNVLAHASRVTCPTLFTFGSVEVAASPAFAGMPEEIERLAGTSPHIQVATIAGADHFYAGCHSEIIGRLERWLRRL